MFGVIRGVNTKPKEAFFMQKELLFTAPSEAIPKIGTQPHNFLSMLSSGDPVKKVKFLIEFGESMRSPLQKLEGEEHLFWKIHKLTINGEAYFQLDNRHLSLDAGLDAEARNERKLEFRRVSYKQAKSETERLPSAIEKLAKAKEGNAQL